MSSIVNMRVGFYILILSMKNNLKKYIILMLVLILFLLPIMQVLSNIEALKGGKAGLIVLGIILFIQHYLLDYNDNPCKKRR